MMQRLAYASLAITVLSSVVGCVGEPPPMAQALATRPSGHHWTDCLDAIDRGVEGDSCTFDPAQLGTALSCATTFPPEVVGWERVGDQRVPIAERELDVLAHCSAGRLVLYRRYESDGPVTAPTIRENGCLVHTLPVEPLGQEIRLCVHDDLLPELRDHQPVDLDQPGACEDILDGIALPGDACSGTTVCASMEPQYRYERPEFHHLVGRPGVYAWCGAGRLRRASSIVELPCDNFDEARQTYVCAMPGSSS